MAEGTARLLTGLAGQNESSIDNTGPTTPWAHIGPMALS